MSADVSWWWLPRVPLLLTQAHMMPDLPNMGMERDIEGFREYFENPLFRSDGTWPHHSTTTTASPL